MRKDPTEFRKRFNRWKAGDKVYKNGLPSYLDGKENIDFEKQESTAYKIPFIHNKLVKLTNAGLATGAVLSTNLLDSIADNAVAAGLPIKTALGLAIKESTLGNPTDDRTAWNLSSHIRKHFNNIYPGTVLHINDGEEIDPVSLINYYKGDIDYGLRDFTNESGSHIIKPVKNQSVLKTGFEFYKKHPDRYNPGLKNHQNLVNKRGEEVMQSPEVKSWYDKYLRNQLVDAWNNHPVVKLSTKKLRRYEDGKTPQVVEKDGVTYNVHPSAVGAPELSVTTPEIIVTGKDRRPAWKRMYQNTNLGDTSQYYDKNALRSAIGLVPGISDAVDGVEAADAFRRGDYAAAGAGTLMLLAPNFLEKPLRYFKRTRLLKKLQREINDVIDNADNYDIINGSAKNWFDSELTFARPFRVKSHNGQTVGDVIDYNCGLYGGANRPLSELTENLRYSIAQQTAYNMRSERPHSGILVHMDETGPQPISKSGFVPKDATNSKSVWNKSLSGAPEIWWNDGSPYYSAKQYINYINIPQSIVAKRQALEDAGLKFNSTVSSVFHAPGEVPFDAIDYGLRPNMFGWFDRVKFTGVK